MIQYKALIRRAGTSSFQTFDYYLNARNLAEAKMILEGMFGRENVINFHSVTTFQSDVFE